MFKTFLYFKRVFLKKPETKLKWCEKDYRTGELWAKTVPHPFKKNKTLWDLCYDRNDSSNTIDNLNKFLFNEI